MHYMILMSEKMTSQKKLGEIKSVPYNKPLLGTSPKQIPRGRSKREISLMPCRLYSSSDGGCQGW